MNEKRKHSRYKFAYPVKFDLFQLSMSSRAFTGIIFNISLGGACVRFEDKYGRVDINSMQGSKVKLAIGITGKEKIFINAMIHWIRKESRKGMELIMGVEFREIEDWQLEQIEKFIKLKNKDQKMIWNLWENYVPQ